MATKFYLWQKFLSRFRLWKSEESQQESKIKKFAFLVHPRISAREDMGKVFYPFYFVPETILQKMIPHFNPIVGGRVKLLDKKEIIGWIIWIPLLGKQFYSLPKDFVFKKIINAIEMSIELGAEIVGLGEFVSSITHGGEDLIGKVNDILITNGNSLTAGVISKAIEKISEIKIINLMNEKIAIVGAGGSVGRGVSLLLAEKGIPLILIEKAEKVDELKKFFSPFNNVFIKNEISSIKDAKIIVVTTSATVQIIKPEYLKEGAVIYDITQPRNTSPDILKERKDVIIIDGGILNTPTIDYGVDIGLRKHQAYACLVETMICALEGIEENYVGYTRIETIKKMLDLMEKYQNYFKLNIFQSFGKPLNNKLEFI